MKNNRDEQTSEVLPRLDSTERDSDQYHAEGVCTSRWREAAEARAKNLFNQSFISMYLHA